MLPEGFQFSQASLQDFAECRRRFQLRYLDRLAWPALETEPYHEFEHLAELGSEFHRLVHQYFLGIDPESIRKQIHDLELSSWWQRFLAFAQSLPTVGNTDDAGIHPERTLVAPIGKASLVVKYDLFIISPDGKCTIYDWKTSQKPPNRAWLADRMQTILYPYMLVHSDHTAIGWQKIQPEKVEMVYWYANFPDTPIAFAYSSAKYNEDREVVSALVDTISTLEPEEYRLTVDRKRCKYCIYRSLCDRGDVAGEFKDFDEIPDISYEYGEDIVNDNTLANGIVL